MKRGGGALCDLFISQSVKSQCPWGHWLRPFPAPKGGAAGPAPFPAPRAYTAKAAGRGLRSVDAASPVVARRTEGPSRGGGAGPSRSW